MNKATSPQSRSNRREPEKTYATGKGRKACPRCKAETNLSAPVCGTCGRLYRTRFDAQGNALLFGSGSSTETTTLRSLSVTALLTRGGSICAVLGALFWLFTRVPPAASLTLREMQLSVRNGETEAEVWRKIGAPVRSQELGTPAGKRQKQEWFQAKDGRYTIFFDRNARVVTQFTVSPSPASPSK